MGCVIEEDVADDFDQVAAAMGMRRSEAMRLAIAEFITAHRQAVPQRQEELFAAS